MERWEKRDRDLYTEVKRNEKIYQRTLDKQTVYLKIIGTSAIVNTEIDSAVGMNSGIFNNPFLIWGRYQSHFGRNMLKTSFQFHHTQMDGAHAGKFLELLQKNIDNIGKKQRKVEQ